MATEPGAEFVSQGHRAVKSRDTCGTPRVSDPVSSSREGRGPWHGCQAAPKASEAELRLFLGTLTSTWGRMSRAPSLPSQETGSSLPKTDMPCPRPPCLCCAHLPGSSNPQELVQQTHGAVDYSHFRGEQAEAWREDAICPQRVRGEAGCTPACGSWPVLFP